MRLQVYTRCVRGQFTIILPVVQLGQETNHCLRHIFIVVYIDKSFSKFISSESGLAGGSSLAQGRRRNQKWKKQVVFLSFMGQDCPIHVWNAYCWFSRQPTVIYWSLWWINKIEIVSHEIKHNNVFDWTGSKLIFPNKVATREFMEKQWRAHVLVIHYLALAIFTAKRIEDKIRCTLNDIVRRSDIDSV